MLGYTVLCIVLGLILLGFLPAMIASGKKYPFVRWYVFGVLVFPVALIEAIALKKPVRIVNVLSSKDHSSRRRKAYKRIARAKSAKPFSLGYILTVFLTKLVFGAFSGLIAFAISRAFILDTEALRIICIVFSVTFTILLSVTEICRFSRIPLLADEITKRALQMFLISAIVSLPMFLAENIITSYVSVHHQFIRFLCTLISFIGFLMLLLKMQRRYYRVFSRFFDYCTISLCSYTVFSAVTLVALSLTKKLRWAVYAFAMQMQLFNFTYFADIKYIVNPESMFVVAMVHLITMVLVLFSGLRCKAFRKKELAYRIEYRTKAFRTSHKRALRRHIPSAGIIMSIPVK